MAARRRAVPLEAALAEATWGALPGTLVAAVAAATAYASLTITGFRGFRQFGTIGAVGMLACWAATYLLAPSLCVAIERLGGHGPPPLRRAEAPARRTPARLLRWVFERPRAVVGVAGLVTLVTLAQVVTLNSTHLESDFSKLRRRDTWTSGEGYWGRFMDRIIGGNLSPTVILTDSAAEASAVAARLRSEMAHPPLAGLVANVRSLDDAVPRDQPAKIAEVMRLRKQLTPVVRATMPPDRVAEIDRLLGTDGLHAIGMADLPPSLTAGLRESDGTLGRVVLVFPRLTKRLWQTAQLEGFIAKLRDVAAQGVPPGSRPGRVAGTLPVSADITASLQRDAPRASVAALVSVAAVVAVIFRGSATGLVVIASLLIGIVWMVGRDLPVRHQGQLRELRGVPDHVRDRRRLRGQHHGPLSPGARPTARRVARRSGADRRTRRAVDGRRRRALLADDGHRLLVPAAGQEPGAVPVRRGRRARRGELPVRRAVRAARVLLVGGLTRRL